VFAPLMRELIIKKGEQSWILQLKDST
jgi:hypothetical protein